MGSNPQNNFDALNKIRDGALMLSLGNAYLCEEPFFIKTGILIDSNIEKVKSGILSLKKKFPGKFVQEVDTDEILEELHNIAQRLQNPDKEISEKCTVGVLGQELETSVNTLARAINTIRSQVEGSSPVYTKTESIINIFGWLKPVGVLATSSFRLIIKLLILSILVAILPFLFLFLTMEKEENLLKEIAQSEVYIKSQYEIIISLDDEKNQISQEIESMEQEAQNREDKIEIIELNDRIYKINENQNKIEVEISLYEKKIEDNRKKIEDVKKKSFIKRLLRQ